MSTAKKLGFLLGESKKIVICIHIVYIVSFTCDNTYWVLLVYSTKTLKHVGFESENSC